MIDPKLLELLCCPATLEGEPCHGELEALPETLRCQRCGLHYPIEDGIPVMLVDRATRNDA